jgi:hypothetical protein
VAQADALEKSGDEVSSGSQDNVGTLQNTVAETVKSGEGDVAQAGTPTAVESKESAPQEAVGSDDVTSGTAAAADRKAKKAGKRS